MHNKMKTNKLRNISIKLVTLAAGMGAGVSVLAGDLTGKITLKGTPPPEKVIDPSADPVCAKLHTAAFTTTHYVVAPDGGLANVFVYIKAGLSGKTFPVPTDAPTLDQEGCFYKPYVMGVQVNQTFKVKNSDPTMHNVHAQPKTMKEFNFAQPAVQGGTITEKKFDKPEVLVRFKCEVHPWMFAFMGVVEHPYFAVSGKDGAFKIPNLPPGKYTLEAVHPKAGVQTQEVTVADSAAANFTFEVKPAN